MLGRPAAICSWSLAASSRVTSQGLIKLRAAQLYVTQLTVGHSWRKQRGGSLSRRQQESPYSVVVVVLSTSHIRTLSAAPFDTISTRRKQSFVSVCYVCASVCLRVH